MDQELKQRLIGAAVVTALAAIFIPMLFDDPVDTSGQTVSEASMPEAPAGNAGGPDSKLPESAASIDNAEDPLGNLTSDQKHPGSESTQGAAPDYQPPDEGDVDLEGINSHAEDNLIDEPIDGENGQDAEVTPAFDEEPDTGDVAASLPRVPVTPPVQQHAPAPKAKQKPAPSQREDFNTATPTATRPAAPEPEPEPYAPVQETKPKPSGKLVRWYLQAGSFSKKENAVSRWEALRKQGLPAMLEPIKTSKGTLYRLRVGPELSKQRALDMKNRMNQMKIKSIILAE